MNLEDINPVGWSVVPLEQLVQEPKSIAYGVLKPGPHDPSGAPLIRIKDLKGGTIDESELHYITNELHQEFKRTWLEGGEVLISIQGTIGRIAIVPRMLAGANISRTLAVIRPKSAELTQWIRYALQAPAVTAQMENVVTGSTRDSLNLADLRKLKIPLAPLDQQKRIVSEIEKQFSRLDEAVANLKRVKANLKRYKAAILKAAVEGRLVETEGELARREGRSYETGAQLLQRILETRRSKWQGKGKYKEPAAPDTTDLPELPEGWVWATVEQLNPVNRPCAYGVLQPGDDLSEGVLFVRVGDINDGRIDPTGLKVIAPAIAEAYPRTKLAGGEVLITLVGAIGRTAVVPASLAGANVARAVGVLPLADPIDPHWVEIWFRNPRKIAEMTAKSHEVARKTLNLEDVRFATVAIPSLTEQQQIVAEVERRLSIADEAEAQVNTDLERAEHLRQAILAKAFKGTRSPSSMEAVA